MFILAWEANQALAALGVTAAAAAYVAWGSDLARDRATRLVGLAGIAAGLLPVGMLASGSISMNVNGAFIVYAVQASWAAIVGLAMLRTTRIDDTQRADGQLSRS